MTSPLAPPGIEVKYVDVTALLVVTVVNNTQSEPQSSPKRRRENKICILPIAFNIARVEEHRRRRKKSLCGERRGDTIVVSAGK